MKKKNLVIISNEKTHYSKGNFFCDNIDMKSIPEGLQKSFNIELFVRKSMSVRSGHKINLKKIIISYGIISYILNILKSSGSNQKYLIISISPYTFIICMLLFFLKKKVYVYLRSDGFEEYKQYSKYFGPLIYKIMFNLASWKSNLIACRSRILRGKKGIIVSPSQLSKKWFVKRKPAKLKKINLLYVGRIKIEKGTFSLLKILNTTKLKFKILLVNSERNQNKILENKNIKITYFGKNHENLIKIYDECNIFILPSFTEGHPQVLDESLSRLRPVIIFPEISHVKRNREGVFISQRNHKSLFEKINFILKRYKFIQRKMLKNKLPTKTSFLNELQEIISSEKQL